MWRGGGSLTFTVDAFKKKKRGGGKRDLTGRSEHVFFLLKKSLHCRIPQVLLTSWLCTATTGAKNVRHITTKDSYTVLRINMIRNLQNRWLWQWIEHRRQNISQSTTFLIVSYSVNNIHTGLNLITTIFIFNEWCKLMIIDIHLNLFLLMDIR